MPFLKALAEESPGELTVHCHILWEELFPNFRHEEINLCIFRGANKSKRQIIFGNPQKWINQAHILYSNFLMVKTLFFLIVLLFHGQWHRTLSEDGAHPNFPLEQGEPDPEAMNNVVWLQKLCYKNQVVSITVTQHCGKLHLYTYIYRIFHNSLT